MYKDGEPEAPANDAPDDEIEPEVWARLADVSAAFSPGAPITRKDLFSGRVRQMGKLIELVGRRGSHGILYGERGVGKTSLAAVVSDMLTDGSHISVRVNCGSTDTFTSIWRRSFEEIALTTEAPPVGFGGTGRRDKIEASKLLGDDDHITPDRLRRAMDVLSRSVPLVVFIDEFDRLPAQERAPFADLIKSLSDYVVGATVVLVGVADDVDELVAEHRSVERALHEILMPRMSIVESRGIVQRGLESISMEVESSALERIVDLSKGLPHYTHLLSQEAAESAIWHRRNTLDGNDVDVAVMSAIEKALQTVKNDYFRAIYSPRRVNLYPHVLRACALAHKDELGFFAPVDVRLPLSDVLGRTVDIPIYQQHLNAFTTETRGQVLQRRGEARRFRYRFRDPLLEPYVIMKGLRDDAGAESSG